MKISVALAVYNEEKNIAFCLKSVYKWVDEIVLADGSSTDNTIDIAKKFKAKVIICNNPPIFHINKQKAIEACKYEWILQLDADEIVTEKLKKEILNVINRQPIVHNLKPVNGYYIPRRNYFLGYWLKKGGAYPDYVLRLFRKGKGRLPCVSVHEQLEVKGKTTKLKCDLIHRPYPTFLEYLRKADVYTTMTAKKLKSEKTKINLFTSVKYIIAVPARTFLNIFFRHLGLLDGFAGFIWALFSALHHPIAYIKYWRNIRSQNN